MMKRAILLFLFPLLAFADPSPATRYLMNENISMLDFGLWKMQHKLEPTIRNDVAKFVDDEAHKFIFFRAYYEWADDLIIFGVSIILGFHDDAEQRCRNILETIRPLIGVSMDYALDFQHKGYESSEKPANLGALLSGRTQLQCEIQEESGKKVFVKSMLLSDDVYVSREGK